MHQKLLVILNLVCLNSYLPENQLLQDRSMKLRSQFQTMQNLLSIAISFLKMLNTSNAYFRRFLIVPFNVIIPENEQDKELAQK